MTRAATALVAALWILAPQDGAPAPLTATLDEIFADPVLARAVVGVRVESLRDGRVIYSRNAATHVVPASNMKIVTMAVAVRLVRARGCCHTKWECGTGREDECSKEL